jgi:hypothetical protein
MANCVDCLPIFLISLGVRRYAVSAKSYNDAVDILIKHRNQDNLNPNAINKIRDMCKFTKIEASTKEGVITTI